MAEATDAITDIQVWKAFLNHYGVEFSEPSRDPSEGYVGDKDGSYFIELKAKTERVFGYGGFFTVVSFDESGKFLHLGIWE